MSRFIKSFIILLLLSVVFIHEARADLLISPLRVAFEGRERSKVVNLVNNSDKSRTYRIEWLEKRIDENGQYTDITPGADYVSSSELIRYSPRQVTLAPNESQAIRMALRKPGNLPDGEYRSHVLFKQLADVADEEDTDVDGPAIKLYVNVSVSIPIIVRHGELSAEASLTNIKFATNEEDEEGFDLRIDRTAGDASPYGSVAVYNPQDTNRLKPLAILNNVAVYPEIKQRNLFVPLENDLPASLSQVLIVYEGRDEYKGRDFDQQLYTLP